RDRMAQLLEESEALQKKHGQLLADLSTTLAAPPVTPGSVEAMLIERWESSLVGVSPRELVHRGFDVVAELIELCDDRRLVGDPLDSGPPEEFKRLGDLADEVLLEISGYEFGAKLSVDMPEEQSALDSAFWTKWWEQARVQ